MEDSEIVLLRRRLTKLQRMFVTIGILLVIFFALICTRVVWVIPKFQRIYADMLGDQPLPGLTQIVLKSSNLLGGLGLPILTVVFPAGVIIFLLRNPGKPLAWGITVSMIVILMIFNLVIPSALMMPMITLITEMNGGI